MRSSEFIREETNQPRNAWADLPNAKHIDRILADLKRNPDKWSATRNAARTATRNAAWNAAWGAAWDDAWDAVSEDARDDAWYAARSAAWNAAETAAWDAAQDAILALIAYDDCAYLLDEKPEHVQMLGLLGNQVAILLYPACVALQKHEPL